MNGRKPALEINALSVGAGLIPFIHIEISHW